jgi:predicted amidophosphoribosyltransferase
MKRCPDCGNEIRLIARGVLCSHCGYTYRESEMEYTGDPDSLPFGSAAEACEYMRDLMHKESRIFPK